jgi:inhibitor of cysteine peptidase
MASQARVLTEADDGRTVEIRAGETLAIRLPENASTGYRWFADKLDPAVTLTASGYDTQDAGAVGGESTVHWALKANAPGRFPVELKLWRQWEGDKSVQKRFRITLMISP